jgi:hypothetical protein
VTLLQPVPAVAGGEQACVVDASIRGVRLSHSTLFAQGARCDVAFEWDGQPIEFVGQIRWTKASPRSAYTYQSGFEISAIKTDSAIALRGLIESCVERALDEQKANAKGIPPLAASFVQGSHEILYARYEFIHGVWRKTMTSDPRQPPVGFTISANESRHQVELLKAAYATSDLSMRQTIRKLAEISVSCTSTPSRRYEP